MDVELVSRLEKQAASGSYTSLDVRTEDLEAPGPHGPVPVRVYHPSDDTTLRPLLVWCHGGGFLGGDLDMPEADATSRELAVRAGAVVVSVGYRLAIRGVHFPVPHDDVLAAYDWATTHACSWGVTGSAVIGGASAGANLAAGVALRLRDEGRPTAGVVLLYPLVHPVLPRPSDELAAALACVGSEHAFRGPGFTPMVENYLGAPASEAGIYAMPGLADLAGYPPTFVINCEYDGLRASGEAFVAALEEAGGPVTQLLARDVLHGHINAPWLSQAQQSYAEIAAWLVGAPQA
jgi:acetyl esterase/lipase